MVDEGNSKQFGVSGSLSLILELARSFKGSFETPAKSWRVCGSG